FSHPQNPIETISNNNIIILSFDVTLNIICTPLVYVNNNVIEIKITILCQIKKVEKKRTKLDITDFTIEILDYNCFSITHCILIAY
ncbi:MAG: hypothetical protein KJZ60_00310, partial [Ignavibacteriaceae bacterium]|nr:hypothetical protein [Ignavibacteriaceae bacterium]